MEFEVVCDVCSQTGCLRDCQPTSCLSAPARGKGGGAGAEGERRRLFLFLSVWFRSEWEEQMWATLTGIHVRVCRWALNANCELHVSKCFFYFFSTYQVVQIHFAEPCPNLHARHLRTNTSASARQPGSNSWHSSPVLTLSDGFPFSQNFLIIITTVYVVIVIRHRGYILFFVCFFYFK